jgi:hypothetical protein
MRPGERGSSLAWTAVLLGLVLAPLLLLLGDGARLWYVRGRITTAAEAACEDASWSTADRAVWQRLRDDRYALNFYLLGRAQSTFYQMLSEKARVRYVPSLSLNLDSQNNRVVCRAQAQLPLLMMPGREITIRVSAFARLRFAEN